MAALKTYGYRSTLVALFAYMIAKLRWQQNNGIDQTRNAVPDRRVEPTDCTGRVNFKIEKNQMKRAK